jgi:hypothetical protein
MYLDVKIFLDKVEEKLNEPIALEIENILGEMSTYEPVPAETLAVPKMAEIKKEFEEQFCLIHTVEDYDNYWSYVDAKATELWKFIEEKLSNFTV